MQIGTQLGFSWLTGATGSSAASAVRSTSYQPAFGPDAQVSLGDSIPTVTGFTDYTQLGASGLWQFDLAAVLNSSATGVTEQAQSDDQRKAEATAVQRAFDLINAGQPDDARQLMNDLLAENKTNAAAVHALATADLSERKYESAEQLFLKAHALSPAVGYDNDARNARLLQSDDVTVLARARSMVSSAPQRSEGIRVLIALTERSPDLAAAHVLLGDSLMRDGDQLNGLMQYNSAISTAETGELGSIQTRLADLARQHPDSAFVRQLIGKIELRQTRYDEAVQTLLKAVSLTEDPTGVNRDLARGYVGQAQALLRRGDVTTALGLLKQARELDPVSREVKTAAAEGYIAQAEQLASHQDPDAALDSYRQAADLLGAAGDKTLRERAARGAYALGQTIQRQRVAEGTDIDGEVRAFQVAYDLDHDNTTYKRKLADARNGLGDQLYAEGEYQDAAYAYKRAHDLYKNDATYKANAIRAFVAYADDRLYNLNYTDAIDAYLAAYRIDPTNVETKTKLANGYNARGLDYRDREKYKLAAGDFKTALRLFPDNETYQANYNSVAPWDL